MVILCMKPERVTAKLKLFTDQSYLPRGRRHIPLLYPFWGFLTEPAGSLDFERFVDYSVVGSSFFSLVSVEDADALLFPCEWQSRCFEIVEMEKLSKKWGKPIIVFFNSDSDEDILVENAIIFRTSLYATRRAANEFSLPGWSCDFVKSYLQKQMPLREKKDVPVIGYTGYTDYHDVISYILSFGRRIKSGGRIHVGAQLRGRAIRLLSQNDRVKTVFRLRNGCLTGSMRRGKRLQYVQNIVDTDYTLVIRGGGNFSYRLYEVLSCGRIPLFVNTDCVLPFDDIIDWRKHMVWVDESELESISEKVEEFHSKLSKGEFLDLQKAARRIYEEWVCPAGFYSNIWRCLAQRKTEALR